jgi:uncharacterized protein (TIGR00645 family)
MSQISHVVESILFRSRFLLAPLYLGLVGALALLGYRFIVEFIHLAEKIGEATPQSFTLDLLALLDLTLLANLILLAMRTLFRASMLHLNQKIVPTGWERLTLAV